jgi:hypothetical protein
MSAAIDMGNNQPLGNSKLSVTIVLRTIGLKQPQYSGGRRYSGSTYWASCNMVQTGCQWRPRSHSPLPMRPALKRIARLETRLIMIRKFAICQKVFDVDLPQNKSKNA